MDKSHLFSRTARKPRSERNCSGFFLCRGIIKRCTPLGSKCTPHRPFVKWYRGVKRKRLHGDNFRITVEPVIVKKYMKTLANRSFYKKKLDTNQDTHCIKIGVQLWCGWRDLNPYPLARTGTWSQRVCRFRHIRNIMIWNFHTAQIQNRGGLFYKLLHIYQNGKSVSIIINFKCTVMTQPEASASADSAISAYYLK